MRDNIRWGIVGLGRIAHSFCNDLVGVEGAKISAVASRSMKKARDFAEVYGVPTYYDSYEQLFASDEVDVVYLATPHSAHYQWVIKALEAKKAVLCEKPLGVNREQVKAMVECARKHEVFLMEALWSRFNPAIARVAELVQDGAIGPVRYLHADFAFYAVDRDEGGRLLNPELAGGSLLDIGIYPIFLSYLLLGKPQEISSFINRFDTGIEVQASLIFKYEKAMALLYSGLNSRSAMQAEISGETGSLILPPRWHEAQGYTLVRNGEKEFVALPTRGKGYTYEIEEVNACLRQGKTESERWSLQHSLDLIGLLDAVRAQHGVTFPFEQ